MKLLWVVGATVAVCLSMCSAAFADSNGLVAAYGFEEPSGTAATDTAGLNPGTLNGPTRTATGRFGAALSFDGVNDRVDVPDSNSLDLSTGMTLEAWVQPTAQNWRTAVMKEKPGGIAYALYASTDTNRPSAEIQAETRAPAAIATNVWTHLATTYDGATLRLYVNGTQVASRAVTGALTISSGALRIGGNAVWGEYFKGLIDEVRVYNRPLTAAEIGTDMNAPVVSSDTSAPTVTAADTCGGTIYDWPQLWTTWSDDRGPVTVRVEVDGQTVTGPTTYTGTSGSFNWIWDTRALANGAHTMRAIARDAAGNQTTSAACDFNVQNKALSVPFTSPIDGQTVSGTVTIKAAPLADGAPLTYRPVNVGLASLPPGATAGPGPYEWTWDTTQAPNGDTALTARLFFLDTGGPRASSTIHVTVDNSVPKPTGLTATVGSNGRDVELHWNWVDGIYDYNVYRDGVKILNTSANYAGDVNVAFGTHSYTVKAVRSGNESAASDSASVTISDNTPPTAPWLTGSVSGADVHLTWEPASDNVSVKEYRVYRDDVLIATRSAGTLAFDALSLSMGRYTYKVVAVDDGGLTGTSREVALTVAIDAIPPTGSLGTCNGTVLHDYAMLMATFSDDLGPVTASVYIDGVLFRGPYTVSRTGSMMFEWDVLHVAEGSHMMTLALRDAAGNETTVPCEWIVHNPAVTVGFPSLTDGQTVSGTVTLTAEARADGQVITGWPLNSVAISVDGAPRGGGAFSPFQAVWDTTKVSNGIHTIKAEAYWMDYGAARATKTIQVRVDNSLARPSGVTAGVTGGAVNLQWDAVTGASEYRVFRDGERIGTATDTRYTDAAPPPGAHSYTVVAANGGATSAPSDPATATVAADTTPPTVTLQAVCDGRALSEYVGPINGTADDDRGPVTVTVDVEDQHVYGPKSVSGAFNFSWDTRENANGPVVMKVTARDAAGNETVKDCPWTVKNSVLSIPITGAADGGTVSGTVALGFRTLADGVPTNAPARFFVDGTQVTDGFVYTYAWDTTKLANGPHTLKAEMGWPGYSQTMATSTIQVRVENTAPAPTGLVAAYGFEESSGTTVTDSSGKGSTGTVSGATSVAGGRFGRALSFDGVNDLVTVPDSSLLDLAPGMTLEAWVKPTTVSDWRTLMIKERPGQLTYGLYASGEGGRPMAEVAAGTQRDARGTAALSVGVWTHVAATYDKSTLRLYVNGTQVASTAVTGTLVNSTGALRIGGNSVWGEYFSGLIDEVRVYERALNPADILADQTRPVSPGS